MRKDKRFTEEELGAIVKREDERIERIMEELRRKIADPNTSPEMKKYYEWELEGIIMALDSMKFEYKIDKRTKEYKNLKKKEV